MKAIICIFKPLLVVLCTKTVKSCDSIFRGAIDKVTMLQYIVSVLTLKTFLVGLVTALFVYWMIRRFKYKLPPGPFALPLFGNMWREYQTFSRFFTETKMDLRNYTIPTQINFTLHFVTSCQ